MVGGGGVSADTGFRCLCPPGAWEQGGQIAKNKRRGARALESEVIASGRPPIDPGFTVPNWPDSPATGTGS